MVILTSGHRGNQFWCIPICVVESQHLVLYQDPQGLRFASIFVDLSIRQRQIIHPTSQVASCNANGCGGYLKSTFETTVSTDRATKAHCPGPAADVRISKISTNICFPGKLVDMFRIPGWPEEGGTRQVCREDRPQVSRLEILLFLPSSSFCCSCSCSSCSCSSCSCSSCSSCPCSSYFY